ncbi:MAG TPA: signal recognition particle-docking protein FtsY [Acidobacteriota bacterium]|nr:signal recognition particle-docking protein FtsY [Acidobacteriota bacterium]
MSIFNYKERPGYFARLKDALKTTSKDISTQMSEVFGKGETPVTEEHLEDLESILIGADIGVETSLGIIDKIREETRGTRVITTHKLKRMIRQEVLDILQASGSGQERRTEVGTGPEVVLVVGVNGVGKTTTIGKLAHRWRQQDRQVLICAADTFRAAAVEQLQIWADRVGADLVKQRQGSDPAAVVFDAVAAAKARGKDVLVIDTAGRLHNKANLMAELEKIRRIAAREIEGAPHQVYLVLDATTGQNGLVQAREFFKVSGVTGLIVAKLDGTAKGGILVAIAKELKIPIEFIGVGEQLGDLMRFSPEAYVDSLFGPRQ